MNTSSQPPQKRLFVPCFWILNDTVVGHCGTCWLVETVVPGGWFTLLYLVVDWHYFTWWLVGIILPGGWLALLFLVAG